MAASESALGALHEALAAVLVQALKGQRTEGYVDPDTGEFVEGTELPPSASVMTVAAKFLKDNDITCAPSDDNELGDLQRIMAERQSRMRGRSLDAADRASIAADCDFLGRA